MHWGLLLLFQMTLPSFRLDLLYAEKYINIQDGKIRCYSWDGTALKLKTTIEKNRGEITSLSYSPNNSFLAAADTQRTVFVFDAVSKEVFFFC